MNYHSDEAFLDDKQYENIFAQDKKYQKLKTDEQLLCYYIGALDERYKHWANIYNSGSNDPFWPDGTNLNLVRNHILYYKRNIVKLCQLRGMAIPKTIEFATPPEIDVNYMANKRTLLGNAVKKSAEPKSEQENYEQLSLLF